jgi:hypothetical protein
MLLGDAGVEDGHRRGVSRGRRDALGVHELTLVIARETVCACVCWAGDSIHVRGELGDVKQHLARESHEVNVALGRLEGHRIGTVLVTQLSERVDHPTDASAGFLGREASTIGPELDPVALGRIEEMSRKTLGGEVVEGCLADVLERGEQRLVARAAGGSVTFGVRDDLPLEYAEVVATNVEQCGAIGRLDHRDLAALVPERVCRERRALGRFCSGEVAASIGKPLLSGLPGQGEVVDLAP